MQCELSPSDWYSTGYNYNGYDYNGYTYFGLDAVSVSGNVIAIGNKDNRKPWSIVYDGNVFVDCEDII